MTSNAAIPSPSPDLLDAFKLDFESLWPENSYDWTTHAEGGFEESDLQSHFLVWLKVHDRILAANNATHPAPACLEHFAKHTFNQLAVFPDGRTPLYLTEEQYNAIRGLVATAGVTPAPAVQLGDLLLAVQNLMHVESIGIRTSAAFRKAMEQLIEAYGRYKDIKVTPNE